MQSTAQHYLGFKTYLLLILFSTSDLQMLPRSVLKWHEFTHKKQIGFQLSVIFLNLSKEFNFITLQLQ